jgi:hypothetical protein
MGPKKSFVNPILWLGDGLTFIVVTLIGFSSHGLLGSSTFLRLLATLIPFYLSWLLFAFWGGVSSGSNHQPRSWLLRSTLSALLSAPFAATLRGFWLAAPVLPLFVLVMAGVSALGILIWRTIFRVVLWPRWIG